MSYIVTVILETDLEKLTAAEQAHPDTIGAILEIAKDYMISHQRYARDGMVMDIDQYRSEEDYRAFFAKAEPHIRKYAANAGTTVQDTLWRAVEN